MITSELHYLEPLVAAVLFHLFILFVAWRRRRDGKKKSSKEQRGWMLLCSRKRSLEVVVVASEEEGEGANKDGRERGALGRLGRLLPLLVLDGFQLAEVAGAGGEEDIARRHRRAFAC